MPLDKLFLNINQTFANEKPEANKPKMCGNTFHTFSVLPIIFK